jgi:hypothetical protein
MMLAALGALAAGFTVGAFAAARPGRPTALISGYVQLCGGPFPGRCWRGEIGFCEAPKGCVTSDRVAAVSASGRRVATQELHRGRFKLHLVPGRYTIELLGDGARVHGQVMQRKKVRAWAHRATNARFFFAVP